MGSGLYHSRAGRESSGLNSAVGCKGGITITNKLKLAYPLFATLLLAGCKTLLGDSKITPQTSPTVFHYIRQIESKQYHCEPSVLDIKSTKLIHESSEENTEEWIVSSCTGEEHSYLIAYKPGRGEALVFNEEIDISGKITDSFVFTPEYDNDNYLAKEMLKEFDQNIESARNIVLNESLETEVLLQKGKGEQYGGKHWLSLCDTPMLTFEAVRIAQSMQLGSSFQTTHCYKWYGTRHNWKETILKQRAIRS